MPKFIYYCTENIIISRDIFFYRNTIDRCSSYERVANEKQYSLVRRFFPKGKSFDNITDKQVAFVENRINNLPRKIFNYHSADFIFNNVLFDIAI